MIAGTVCHRCIDAVCEQYPIGRVAVRYTCKGSKTPSSKGTERDMAAAFRIALDVGKEMATHQCCYEVETPMGDFMRCSCVHQHSA